MENKNYDYIKKQALSLGVGDSRLVHCPYCDNDIPYSPSMSITRDEDKLLYHCFRAVCGRSGAVTSLSSGGVVATTSREFTPKTYSQPTAVLNNDQLQYLFTKYCIRPSQVDGNGFMWEVDGAKLVMPLWTSNGYQFGHNTKNFGTSAVKSMNYVYSDNPMLSYARRDRPVGTVILVEDILSAVRVNQWAQGVALLGTNLNDNKVRDLLAYGAHRVILALDPDALGNAIRMKKKYGLYFLDEFKVVSLSKDPKDLPNDQLKEELGL